MPILCDGTQDAFAIRHPRPEQDYALRSVLGVYVVRESGLQPLHSSALAEPVAVSGLSVPDAGEAPSYQLEERLTPLGPRPYLVLRAPRALLSPLRLHVDAVWYQPGIAEPLARAGGVLCPLLPDRVLEGVSWSLLGGVRAESESPLRSDMNGLLRILSLSMRPVLGEPELRWLMELLIGTGGPAVFRRLPARLEQLTLSVAPDSALRGSGIRHVYRARMAVGNREDEALAWYYLRRVHAVLDAWNQDSSVDLQVDTGERELLPLATAFT